MSNWITSFENKYNRLKEKTTLKLLVFYYIFSLGRALDLETVTSEDPWSVHLGSPLAGNGRVARKISILSASLSLVGSWGAAGGLVASEVTPLITSASFPVTPGCSATFGGLPEEGGTLLVCHLEKGVCLGADGGGGTNGRGIVYILCPLEYRRGLNPNLVKGLIPYLKAIVSTYPQELSP